ncbi:TPA: helix-turn-helix domain-containing protein [Clostridium botulinum]|uniref:helix-turn-helix domain-containing protein n=1 Tax=Clostridium botulinum TaxID=1491 RepID=UPI0008FC6198|nr:helix-turn-helix transcriptional regulator [Clostridium botulinum]APC79540.1 helix-turn-helix family protein [Clostridium botulinum]MCS4449137.1 helix-turn-helix domain-containing protein [Clostridium botulinum]MCS4459088.1 helix-turn-helix domain-containing protein [Clostridium botulinum]MCS4462475.1 helix-turn-helix domain-containing protein [Clostridium botulinum]MCS4512201.1 helix-turn-helix domain-containing protein [Clostridium botulinum]
MFGKNIKRIRELKGLGVNELSRLSGVNASYISAMERGEKENPTITTLKKLADTLEVTVDELIKEESITHEKLKEWDNKYSDQIKEESALYETGEFKTAEAAMKFILQQPSIMGFGGFDASKMSDQDIIDFANELLNIIKMLGPKYNK